MVELVGTRPAETTAAPRFAASIENRAADLRLPLHGIVLVEDPADLPAPCRVRADLREHTFGPHDAKLRPPVAAPTGVPALAAGA